MKRNAAICACLAIQLCPGIPYPWSTFKGNTVRAYGAEPERRARRR